MKKIGLFVIGLLTGALLFSGGVVYAASGILAERSAQAVYVDGQRVELEAYNIGGSNYVKLRDIGEAVDFEVYWDGAAIQIDSGASYTGEAPRVEKTDYSAAANPDVFTEVYTRDAYNAVYEVLLGLSEDKLIRSSGFKIQNPEERWRFETALADLANGITLSLDATGSGVYEVYAHKTDTGVADAATNALIQDANTLRTDEDKVRLLNEFLCEKIVYDGKTYVGINEIANAVTPIEGSCGAFADAMNYLCGRLGIPCISVHGEHHFWNAVYCDGRWSYVDVSLNDQVANHAYLLFASSTKKQSSDPEAAQFLKELLVPGSTK